MLKTTEPFLMTEAATCLHIMQLDTTLQWFTSCLEFLRSLHGTVQTAQMWLVKKLFRIPAVVERLPQYVSHAMIVTLAQWLLAIYDVEFSDERSDCVTTDGDTTTLVVVYAVQILRQCHAILPTALEPLLLAEKGFLLNNASFI